MKVFKRKPPKDVVIRYTCLSCNYIFVLTNKTDQDTECPICKGKDLALVEI